MNTAELLAQAIDNIAELFTEEVELIDDDKIQPIPAFESAKDLKMLLELVCYQSDEGGEHEDEEHHDDKDGSRRLDGHETAADPMHDAEHHMEVDEMDEMAVKCLKAYRLLDSMTEFVDKETTDERRQEISDMWGQGLDDAWSELFDGASAIATSFAGIATAVAVLSF